MLNYVQETLDLRDPDIAFLGFNKPNFGAGLFLNYQQRSKTSAKYMPIVRRILALAVLTFLKSVDNKLL
jgi:hypothetical protein